MKKPPVTERPTSWWREKLEQRRTRMQNEHLALDEPMAWTSDAERRGAIKFFNAAFRAEESGLTQAHQLASEVDTWDPELGRVLRLYGDEEGWHRQLLTEFLAFIGGEVTDMGRVTRTFYRWYARAKRMETIVLTNLMFETVGSTTYRLALRNVQRRQARQMLTILTRDESFHVHALRGPGFWQADLMFSKDFRFLETQGLQVRVEIFNIANRLNYENPAATLPNGTPGVPFTDTQTGTFGYMLGPLNRTVGLGTARQTQVSVRYSF